MREQDVDTPALIVDMDALEANLDRMARLIAPTGAKLRAHAKTHKSPVIAHWQRARGAIGQCVQKVAEAEALIWGGVDNLLLSNQVVGSSKLARFVALSRMAEVAICVDDFRHVEALEAAASDAARRIDVLVEIDVGMDRCGVAPGAPAVELAQRIARSRHLRFKGLQAYHGGAQHLRTPQERESAIRATVAHTRHTLDALRAAGLACEIVGGAGTGTFEFELDSGIYTEIQAGSYCFMDADYARNHGGHAAGFAHALFVLTTVMSQTRPGRAVVDAGLKALAVDSGLPLVHGRDIRYIGASDEHGNLRWDAGAGAGAGLPGVDLGEKIRLIPGHCDPTVDRFDWYVGVRQGRVEAVWPVAARGAAY
ncbi:DSD1 family PLP-dependent enzyme [Robbsia betulipollinis]|nr:DSD1 family PLP-dependent enzyme [Robbsia betulipollinis]